MDYNVSLDNGTILVRDVNGVSVNSDNLVVLGRDDYFIPLTRVKEIRAVNLNYESETTPAYKVNVGKGKVITLKNISYYTYNTGLYTFEDTNGDIVYLVNENYINSFTAK